MKKLITIGIALLLLGLIAGMPYRALGAEEVIEEGNVVTPRNGPITALAVATSRDSKFFPFSFFITIGSGKR